ncbi:MAG: glycosyltransferase family 25 protein [Bermanella sp.]
MKFKIFVINLDERADKFKNAEDQILAQNLVCERISAVRGSNLSQQELEQAYNSELNKKNYLKALSLGEIGCYLSHISAWQKIVDEDLDYAIVLEDDCKLEANFKEITKIIPLLKDWDYMKLTGPRGGRKIQERQSIIQGFELTHFDKVPTSASGQVISFAGAKKLLAHSTPFYRPVDVDIQQYWEKGIDVIGIEPKLTDTCGMDSDITAMAKASGRANKSAFWPRIQFRITAAIKTLNQNKKRPNLSLYLK